MPAQVLFAKCSYMSYSYAQFLSLPLEAWVNNISDEVTRGITANTPLRGPAGARSRIGFIDEPRTYGITARAKF